MAMQDNAVLPGPTNPAGAGGMNPQIQAFLDLLMGGGLHGFGGFGGQPFGGFGEFLRNNPALMRGLGLLPPGAPHMPVQDTTAGAPDAAAPGPGLLTMGGPIPRPPQVDISLGGGAPGAPAATFGRVLIISLEQRLRAC